MLPRETQGDIEHSFDISAHWSSPYYPCASGRTLQERPCGALLLSHIKSLKRHLRTVYNLTPDQYRAKWGLAHDYLMVPPNYARADSELAKQVSLGTRRRKTPEPTPPAAPPKGRRKKAA